MEFSAARVVSILLSKFGKPVDNLPPNRSETRIAKHFAFLLEDAELGCLDVDEKVDLVGTCEETVDDPDWSDEVAESVSLAVPGRIPLEKIQEAWEWYSSSDTGHRSLSSVNKKCRFIKTEYDFRKVKEYGSKKNVKENRILALKKIASHVFDEFLVRMREGISMHDADLRAIALRFNKENKLIPYFKASSKWLQTFKVNNRITSRRVTKFVAKKHFKSRNTISTAATDFVAAIKEQMKNLPLSILANADQTGCVKEMHPSRTLAEKGAKTVEMAANSLPALTHGYTTMPTIFADGSLGEMLFLVLQEPKGQFPKKGHFQADNLVVRAHTSHIMTKQLLLDWVENCLFIGAPKEVLLVVDSWPAFRDHTAMQSVVPFGYKLTVQNIPPGATSMIQPLDVFFFRTFKQMIKRFTSFVEVQDIDFPVHQRDNILKMVSMIYYQFRSPRFQKSLQYPWFAAGYTDNHPGPFQTTIQACFPEELSEDCEVLGCDQMVFIACAHCDKHFCFPHFVIDYHRC